MKTLRQKIVWHFITTGPTLTRDIISATGATRADVSKTLLGMVRDGYKIRFADGGRMTLISGPGIESTYSENGKQQKRPNELVIEHNPHRVSHWYKKATGWPS